MKAARAASQVGAGCGGGWPDGGAGEAVNRRLRAFLGAFFLLGTGLLSRLATPEARAQVAEAQVYVARGILAYEEKRYEEALSALAEALRLDPNNVDALYYTGLANIALKRFDRAVEALEQARRRQPEDLGILFQLGALYFGLQRYDEAQPLLERVFAVNPRLESLGYYVGFMRYRKRDYQGALRAFRQGTSVDPNVQQLTRFYTGLALGVLGLPVQAAAEIEEALRLQPASPLTGPAERLRGAVVAVREAERRFRGELRLGGFFDDNVPVNPDRSDDPLVQVLRRRRQESSGELGALRVDYTFFRHGAFDAIATYSFFTTYNNDLPSFNVMDHLGALSASYRGELAGRPVQAGLQYAYDFLTLGGDEFVQRHTVTASAAVLWSARHLTAVQLRYQRKDFANDENIPPEEKRDADNYLAGFTHVFRFDGDRHFLRLGYQFDWDDTEAGHGRGRNLAYVGHRVLAGAQYTLPWRGIRLRYDFDIHFRNYLHRHTLLPVTAPGTRERADAEQTHALGFTVPLPWNLWLSGDVLAIYSRSNLDVFTYHRRVYSLTLGWSF